MLLPHLSWKTLPADLLHVCTQFSSTITRRSQRWQCPDCHTSVSSRQDLTKHMKIHGKAAEKSAACILLLHACLSLRQLSRLSDCPVLLPQTCNLDGHRLRHQCVHYSILSCSESDTVFSALVTKSSNAWRIRTAFGAGVLRTGSPTIGENTTARLHLTKMAFPTRTPYEGEPPVDPPPSSASSSRDLNAPSRWHENAHGQIYRSPGGPNRGQAQVVTRDEDVEYFWTSPGTGFKHGDPCYSPEAKQLFPAASAGPLDEGLGDIPSLEELWTGSIQARSRSSTPVPLDYGRRDGGDECGQHVGLY